MESQSRTFIRHPILLLLDARIHVRPNAVLAAIVSDSCARGDASACKGAGMHASPQKFGSLLCLGRHFCSAVEVLGRLQRSAQCYTFSAGDDNRGSSGGLSPSRFGRFSAAILRRWNDCRRLMEKVGFSCREAEASKEAERDESGARVGPRG